jgi:hypothetical protein
MKHDQIFVLKLPFDISTMLARVMSTPNCYQHLDARIVKAFHYFSGRLLKEPATANISDEQFHQACARFAEWRESTDYLTFAMPVKQAVALNEACAAISRSRLQLRGANAGLGQLLISRLGYELYQQEAPYDDEDVETLLLPTSLETAATNRAASDEDERLAIAAELERLVKTKTRPKPRSVHNGNLEERLVLAMEHWERTGEIKGEHLSHERELHVALHWAQSPARKSHPLRMRILIFSRALFSRASFSELSSEQCEVCHSEFLRTDLQPCCACHRSYCYACFPKKEVCSCGGAIVSGTEELVIHQLP